MSKKAFIFPGQGAQYAGMGKDFYDTFAASRNVYEQASEACGLDVEKLCFEDNQELHVTKYTQIAMVTTCIAILKAVQEKGLQADVHAGLSLGEYAALAASGVFEEKEIYKLVQKRGLYMQEAYPEGGAMAAVLGLDADTAEKVCEKAEGIVTVANYNCPGQIVITGDARAVKAAEIPLKEAGAKRIIPLNVSGPFHSELLKPASDRLKTDLDQIQVLDYQVPYVSNVTADYVADKNAVKGLLTAQVVSSVRWQQSVEKMIQNGVDTFIEIGPGKTLTGFIRKIDRQVQSVNIQTVDDLEKVKEYV